MPRLMTPDELTTLLLGIAVVLLGGIMWKVTDIADRLRERFPTQVEEDAKMERKLEAYRKKGDKT